MTGDLEAEGGDNTSDAIQEDTQAIGSETKDLVLEARSSLVMLICTILLMSLLSILLSVWLAKTITNTSSSFTTIIGRYFGFDRNETEPILTWWTPLHSKFIDSASRNAASDRSNSTTTTVRVSLQIPYSDYPRFHTIVLPLLFIGAILSAVAAYYARIKCTNRGFAWGAVPKVPLGRVDPVAAAAVVAAVNKAEEAKPSVDYDIVQGSKEESTVFALSDPLQMLNEEREAGAIIDEGTQYDIEDIPKVITHISSAPDLQADNQTALSSSQERQHMIEMLQRQPLPAMSPST